MDGSTLLLAVIAGATAVMALVQIGVVVYAVKISSRVNRLITVLEHEIKPTLARVGHVSADVERVTSLASSQVERIDTLLGEIMDQADHFVTVAQESVVRPVKQGSAFIVGLRAALLAFRGMVEVTESSVGERSRSQSDENAVTSR